MEIERRDGFVGVVTVEVVSPPRGVAFTLGNMSFGDRGLALTEIPGRDVGALDLAVAPGGSLVVVGRSLGAIGSDMNPELLADDRCAPQCVDAEGVSAVTRGKTLLPINAAAWGVAAAGLSVGTYLLLTSGSPPSSTGTPTASTSRIDATVSPQGGALRVSF